MKITFILPHARLEGGVRVVAIYADLLRQRGHEVFVVSWPEKPLRRRDNIKAAIFKNLTRPSYISHFDSCPYVSHRILESRRPVVDADLPDADVVIATWWETAEWVANLSPQKGAKIYFIQHHEASFDYLPQERVEKTYQLPLKKITISQWLVDLMRVKYDDNDVSMVFNSVDTGQFYGAVRKKGGTPTVGMLYSPVFWKGCDVSLKAFGLVRKNIPNLQLVAFGTEDINPNLVFPEGVRYFRMPKQEAIREIYNFCDVWMCGSRAEGFHLPPLEAMACRCPVVSTTVGGPADIIKDGVNGYLVPQEDIDSLAARLHDVLSLPNADWQKMSDEAYKTATQYTWGDAVELFENVLIKNLE